MYGDNYSAITFSDNQDYTSSSSEVNDCMDYYFIYGSNADGVLAQMRDLVGSVSMFPLGIYAFWQSKEHYKTQDESVGVVKKYRELGMHFDGIIQDYQYWGRNYFWNVMEFLNPEFYDPQKLINEVSLSFF